MDGMKISVNLPEQDVAFLDAQGENRSALLHEAVELLRRKDLDQQYAMAFAEFADSGEQAIWDATTSDGIQ